MVFSIISTCKNALDLIKNKDKIVKLKASCVFQEPQFDSKLVKIVVEGTNAQIGTLDPLGVNIKRDKDFYLQLLRNMAKSLKDCLG